MRPRMSASGLVVCSRGHAPCGLIGSSVLDCFLADARLHGNSFLSSFCLRINITHNLRYNANRRRRFRQVAYPLAADNVSRPLVSRLKGLHQPVVRSRIRFSAPRARLLACLSTGLSPSI